MKTSCHLAPSPGLQGHVTSLTFAQDMEVYETASPQLLSGKHSTFFTFIYIFLSTCVKTDAMNKVNRLLDSVIMQTTIFCDSPASV